MAEGAARGRPRGALDVMIVTIGEAKCCVIVTDREKFCWAGSHKPDEESEVSGKTCATCEAHA